MYTAEHVEGKSGLLLGVRALPATGKAKLSAGGTALGGWPDGWDGWDGDGWDGDGWDGGRMGWLGWRRRFLTTLVP